MHALVVRMFVSLDIVLMLTPNPKGVDISRWGVGAYCIELVFL